MRNNLCSKLNTNRLGVNLMIEVKNYCFVIVVIILHRRGGENQLIKTEKTITSKRLKNEVCLR